MPDPIGSSCKFQLFPGPGQCSRGYYPFSDIQRIPGLEEIVQLIPARPFVKVHKKNQEGLKRENPVSDKVLRRAPVTIDEFRATNDAPEHV